MLKFRLKPKMPARILLDSISLLLIITCLAYYWKGNRVHEWLGLALFVLIALHNTVNRLWYRHLKKHVQQPKPRIVVVLNSVLIVTALMLLASSLVISRGVFPSFSERPPYFIRAMHFAAAYWLLVLVAIHVGINASKVVNWAKKSNVFNHLAMRSSVLLVLIASSIAGIFSIGEMVFIDKLLMNPVLFMWDFADPAGFILHHLAIFILISFTSFWLFQRIAWPQMAKQKASKKPKISD